MFISYIEIKKCSVCYVYICFVLFCHKSLLEKVMWSQWPVVTAFVTGRTGGSDLRMRQSWQSRCLHERYYLDFQCVLEPKNAHRLPCRVFKDSHSECMLLLVTIFAVFYHFETFFLYSFVDGISGKGVHFAWIMPLIPCSSLQKGVTNIYWPWLVNPLNSV